jgi:hypothetical protein
MIPSITLVRSAAVAAPACITRSATCSTSAVPANGITTPGAVHDDTTTGAGPLACCRGRALMFNAFGHCAGSIRRDSACNRNGRKCQQC